MIQPIDYFLAAWFALALASALYVGWDQYRNNPEPTVMKWGFILVTLYMGPLGLLLYVLADKEPRPGEHETFVQPLWKQGAGSTIHCVAGEATGIILAAAVTAALGLLPMWLDLIVEYAAGFAFGLFIFQSLFNPPAGSVFLGWTSAPVANTNNAHLYRISNPNFGPQVYSQHDVSTSAGTCSGWPRGERIYSHDITGAIDGGSSGSPVLNASSQVVGQLSGTCGTNPSDACASGPGEANATVDGAFAFYYSTVQPILSP